VLRFAILLVISALMASWASYWLSASIRSLNSRAGRIVSLVCPIILAGLLLVFAGTVLGASGIDIQLSNSWPARQISAILFGIAILLMIPTLLIAQIASGVSRVSARTPRDSEK
jgi:hypothetical protein